MPTAYKKPSLKDRKSARQSSDAEAGMVEQTDAVEISADKPTGLLVTDRRT